MSYTEHHLYFDDIRVGQEWESQGRTVTEADVVNFAGLSGDFNPIHVDREFAKTTSFRQPIAHGVLIWAIGSGLAVACPTMRTLAFTEIRGWHFRRPVFIGDTIRVQSKVLDIEVRSRGRRAAVAWERKIMNQEARIVQEGVLLTLVEGRAARETIEEDTPEASGEARMTNS
jgi:3-hydroxybutyryl-CoA dehydratase